MLMVKRTLSILLVPALAWSEVVVYGMCLDYFSDIIPVPNDSRYAVAVLWAQGCVAAIANALIYCYPLALFYGRHAHWVAICVATPVVTMQLLVASSSQSMLSFGLSAFETLVFITLFVGAAWSAQTLLARFSSVGKGEKQHAGPVEVHLS